MNAEPTTATLPAPSEVDEDLMALPAPPWKRRMASMTVMALTVSICIGLVTALAADLNYFLSESAAVDLGAATALDVRTVETNRFVRIEGTPMASTSVRYSRLFGGAHEVSALAGQRAVFIHRPVGDGDSPRREFAGRIVTFRELGSRGAPILEHLKASGMSVSKETLLLMVDEPPGAYATSMGLIALAVVFVLINLSLLWRWFRPIVPVSLAERPST